MTCVSVCVCVCVCVCVGCVSMCVCVCVGCVNLSFNSVNNMLTILSLVLLAGCCKARADDQGTQGGDTSR